MAYLRRIGCERPGAPSLEALCALHRAHVRSVPFENLDVMAGRPIHLDADSLFDKVVRRRRGGFCYELNGLFAALLTALGHRVDLLSARAVCADGSFGPPFDHLALAVHLDEPFLADVGFGDSFHEPLPLRPDVEHVRPEGAYRLTEVPGEWQFQRRAPDGAWEGRYLFSLQPYCLEDFTGMCRFHQSPASPFTRRRLCTIARPDGRVTLSGSRLITTTRGVRAERDVPDGELDATLESCFGIPAPASMDSVLGDDHMARGHRER